MVRKLAKSAFLIGLVAVIALSLVPQETLPETGTWDKLNHALAYGVLAALGGIGFKGWRVRIPMIATTRTDRSRPPVPIDRDHRFRLIATTLRVGRRRWCDLAPGGLLMSSSFRLVNGGDAVFLGLDLSHGGSVEFEAVGVVDDAI